VACGRLSYTYGLSGPCVSVDTACSTALVATHFLRRGVCGEECDQGVAAAVNLALSRHTNVMFVRAGMLTADGRCKTLDATADGYTRQEACGAIAISSTSDALDDKVGRCWLTPRNPS
jgi:acyl transferase domain-containing protein